MLLTLIFQIISILWIYTVVSNVLVNENIISKNYIINVKNIFTTSNNTELISALTTMLETVYFISYNIVLIITSSVKNLILYIKNGNNLQIDSKDNGKTVDITSIFSSNDNLIHINTEKNIQLQDTDRMKSILRWIYHSSNQNDVSPYEKQQNNVEFIHI